MGRISILQSFSSLKWIQILDDLLFRTSKWRISKSPCTKPEGSDAMFSCSVAEESMGKTLRGTRHLQGASLGCPGSPFRVGLPLDSGPAGTPANENGLSSLTGFLVFVCMCVCAMDPSSSLRTTSQCFYAYEIAPEKHLRK